MDVLTSLPPRINDEIKKSSSKCDRFACANLYDNNNNDKSEKKVNSLLTSLASTLNKEKTNMIAPHP